LFTGRSIDFPGVIKAEQSKNEFPVPHGDFLIFDLLTAQGIYTVYAGVTIPNEASIELHKSLGFT